MVGMSDEREPTVEICGVDMPPAGEGNYCPCSLPEGHDGPHRFKSFAWPQASDDSRQIFRDGRRV